ncbi:Actin-binding, cofilin/tropomyosin type [Penicillium expansum]|uniref:Cofilin n=1 Tax=Penicillium expansum TaxID=27334 RepID=A0A0A2IWT2_PENEN|nr:Actin-binding, cofilin/tropomyosin type [Penicillium expansum]KGO46971.1 Actin-binding, cofilin/tropomyosin type [Penicillium expansum]KGO58969.1 Actin-binding, cofilin/tropomyosin type [Penicillium expansum]
MPNPSGISITEECISAFNQLRSGPEGTRPKFIIYKISDDYKSIVVEETSTEKDWDFFRGKLWDAADKDGNPVPRYAVYDMEYEVGSEGKQQKLAIPLDLKVSIDADCMEDLEWAFVVKEVSEELGMGK